MRANRIVTMPSEGMGTARGNCGVLDISTILSKDSLEANLLALMRADRQVQHKRPAEQAAVDLEADKEIVPSGQNRARIADATMSDLVTRLPQETVFAIAFH